MTRPEALVVLRAYRSCRLSAADAQTVAEAFGAPAPIRRFPVSSDYIDGVLYCGYNEADATELAEAIAAHLRANLDRVPDAERRHGRACDAIERIIRNEEKARASGREGPKRSGATVKRIIPVDDAAAMNNGSASDVTSDRVLSEMGGVVGSQK